MLKLEWISTGEEVLSGQIVDTNAAWFANTLMEQGIELSRKVTVGDRLEDLVGIFQERSHHADVILVNGGLGPTSDDLSAEAMAAAKGEPLVENTEWREILEGWFARNGRMMAPSNLKQTMLPESAVMIHNPHGTACGFRVKLNRAWLFFTPGVPAEFKPMIHEQFLPFLREECGAGEAVGLKKLLTLGHGESSLAERLQPMPLPEGVTMGYRASMPYIEIKLFARGDAANEKLEAVASEVKRELGQAVVSESHPNLALEVHERMIAEGKTLSLAESCTGGLLASQLVEHAGSSAYLHQGLVTYCNESKMKVLDVKAETLEAYGAVSLPTVKEMAEGARNLLNSDYGLATSGIAGPDGGTDEKPVGMVCLALATPLGTWCQTILLPRRSRHLIRIVSAAVAYDMLRRALKDEDPIVEYPFIRRAQVWVG